MVELFANSEDLDQTPRSAASDLGLRCLPITLLGVSRLQLVTINGPCHEKKRVFAFRQVAAQIHHENIPI